MKKLTVNRLALSNLKARKKQYTLMVAGIILAMIFSSGIIFFISCISTSLTELSYNGYGAQDIIITQVLNEENLKGAVEKWIFSEYGTADILGFAYTDDKETKGFSVARYDEKALELSRHSVSEGRLPEKPGEIAVEYDALARLRLKPEIGDNLTFTFKVQNSTDYLEKKIKKTYTLVGILNDKRNHIQQYNVTDGLFDLIPAAIVSKDEMIEAGGKERKCAYASFGKKDKNRNYYGQMSDYNDASKFTDLGTVEWTDANPYWNLGGEDIETKGILAGVLAAVLTVASCVGIVNSFNTNLQERKKQIGLLRAVGATNRQIISVFGREAFIIALLSAPVSVIASYFLSKAVIHFMGDDMVFAPKMWILFAGAALSVIVVMIAALVPLISASMISPMQSIRSIDFIRKMKNKKIRSRKNFEVSKLLASRDIAFSRGKTSAVCVMLIISFLLGSIGISFLKFQFENVEFDETDYKIFRSWYAEQNEFANYAGPDGYGIPNAAISEIMSMPYVDSIDCEYYAVATVIPTRKYSIIETLKEGNRAYDLDGHNACPELTADNYEDFFREQEEFAMSGMSGEDFIVYKKYVLKPELEAKQKFNIGENWFGTHIRSLSDDNIKNLKNNVTEGRINIEKINSGEEIILVLPQKIALTYRAENKTFDNVPKTFVSIDPVWIFGPDGKLRDKNAKIIKTVENEVHAGDEMDISMVFDQYAGPEGINFMEDIYSAKAKQYRKTVRVGAIINQNGLPLACGDVITSLSGYAVFGAPEVISKADINLNCECNDEIDNVMTDTLNAIGSGNIFDVYSQYAAKQEGMQQEKMIIVAFASIVILFFAVCTSLINNSMTAKIREDKRQIGTLRAVGATASELTKAYVLRLLRIFAIGFVGGFAAYGILHTGIYLFAKYKNDIGDEGFMQFLVWPAIIFCVLMFGICSFNLWRQIKKQMKYSIVDNIREL